MRSSHRPALLALFLAAVASGAPAQELGDAWGTANAEAEHYRIVELPIPRELALECGSFVALPEGKLAIGTRRGEILIVDGAFEPLPQPEITTFAAGLDEVLGLGYRDGAFYATQQTEVTRISDRDGDGRADRFENLSDVWGFEHYHEFAWGSPVQPDGSVYVVLGLSSSYHYRADYRGFAFQITPEGESIPVATGVRSAGGVAPNEHGVMFYVESQGPWNGSCSLKHLKPGGFMGHPICFPGYDLPLGRLLGAKPAEPENRSRLHAESQRIDQLVPYAVVFPYRRMGQSITAFRPDRTGGKFGPFQDQLFVGDYSLSIVMRATTEEVDGVWQGACYPFRRGLKSGITRVLWGEKGTLWCGLTNRGWGSLGGSTEGLQRLVWKGAVPFELKEITATKDGFRVAFTAPVDAGAVTTESFALKSWTYDHHSSYGCPPRDTRPHAVTSCVVAADGLSAELEVADLELCRVYEVDCPGVRAADGAALLHGVGYYTRNRAPE